MICVRHMHSILRGIFQHGYSYQRLQICMTSTFQRSYTADEILALAKGKLCICPLLIKDCTTAAYVREILLDKSL